MAISTPSKSTWSLESTSKQSSSVNHFHAAFIFLPLTPRTPRTQRNLTQRNLPKVWYHKFQRKFKMYKKVFAFIMVSCVSSKISISSPTQWLWNTWYTGTEYFLLESYVLIWHLFCLTFHGNGLKKSKASRKTADASI